MKTLNELLGWSRWKAVGTQLDTWRRTQYEVFQKTNNRTGLNKYKKVKMLHASCHAAEAIIHMYEGVK